MLLQNCLQVRRVSENLVPTITENAQLTVDFLVPVSEGALHFMTSYA